jgi:NADPH:quinone reductase-like Zn-dependent oxidoreductase
MRFGGPEVLRPINIPLPEPGRGEVRIRVHAAAVNPTDAIFRAGNGQARLLGDRPPPFVPGMDAAGIIDKIGPNNDGRLAVGDPVIALVLPAGPRGGACADQIVAPSASVVRAPAGVTLTAAATLPLNGLAARVALDALALTRGQTVAVTGSAGALGGYVIQLARADGLTVVADAAPADTELIRSLGADVVVARGEQVAAAIRAAVPAGVNGLVDAANQQALVLGGIADGGGLAEVRGWAGPGERNIAVHTIVANSVAADTRRLEQVRDLAERGTLTLRVAKVLPAERAAEAHRRLEHGGLRGRFVLDFTQ